MASKSESPYNRAWILRHGIPIVKTYGGQLTLRALHYRLVAEGMTNDIQHYKKVVDAMTTARWNDEIAFDDIVDHERETIGETAYEETDVDSSVTQAKEQIKAWATSYRKNRWENQPAYVEVFIEKKALQGVFEPVCRRWNVALNPCKGYPSLTFQYEAKKRFDEALDRGKIPVILYFGDYDCSGEDIPRSIQETLQRMGTSVDIKRVALMKDQVISWKLPPAPTKSTDSRGANWDGLGQVELDAVEPRKIQRLCEDAIKDYFDQELYDELQANEQVERKEFKRILKRDFKQLLDE